MVIGKVLPDSINSTNILGESTTNSKYVSRLPTISPIKFTNSVSIDSSRSSLNNNDFDEYEQDTTTIIHNTNNKNINKNIFTPNTATTAVESNDSRQDLKMKKLRKFSESIRSEVNGNFDDGMINHKNLQPPQLNFVDDNNYYNDENDSFETDEIYEYHGIDENNEMEYLREKEKMLELEQQKLLLEKEQMKLRISRSTSLRNMKTVSPKKRVTNNNFMLSRSSSIHSNIHDFCPPNERQTNKLANAKSMLNLRASLNNKKSIQSNGKHMEFQEYQEDEEYNPPVVRKEINFPRYKSMGNLRVSSLNDDTKIQRKQSMYLRPRVSSSSLYEQKLRKRPSYYSTHSNAHYEASPRHQVNEQSPRYRRTDDEYRSINEEPSGIYNVQGDYLDEESEEEYDETFYEDFDINDKNNHKLLLNYQPSNQQVPVDYWSVPQEYFKYENVQMPYNVHYDNKSYRRVKLQPIQKQNMHKELQLKNFEERYTKKNTYHKKMKVYDPSLYMNKIKDGYVSGMMKYDGKEKRWLGGDRTMDYLPDFDTYQKNNYNSALGNNMTNFTKAKMNYHKPKSSLSNIKMKSYPSMKNLKLNNQSLDIGINANFSAGVLSKWYAYENDIQGLNDRWVGDVEVDEWEIYDLVRNTN
ncbi:hypothetical protein ACO0OL_000681 [Hanseniaspora opuntiae]